MLIMTMITLMNCKGNLTVQIGREEPALSVSVQVRVCVCVSVNDERSILASEIWKIKRKCGSKP